MSLALSSSYGASSGIQSFIHFVEFDEFFLHKRGHTSRECRKADEVPVHSTIADSRISIRQYGTTRTMKSKDEVDGAQNADARNVAAVTECSAETSSNRRLAPASDESTSDRPRVIPTETNVEDLWQCRDRVQTGTDQNGPLQGRLHFAPGCTLLEAKASIAASRRTNAQPSNCDGPTLPPPWTQNEFSGRPSPACSSLYDGASSERSKLADQSYETHNVRRTGKTNNGQIPPIVQAKQDIVMARRMREAELPIPYEQLVESQRSTTRRARTMYSQMERSVEYEPESVVQVVGFYPAMTTSLDDVRERIAREARTQLKAEVPLAEPVNLGAVPNTRTIPARLLFAAVSLLVATCLVGVIVWYTSSRDDETVSIGTPQPTRPPATYLPTMAPVVYLQDGRRAFTTNGQLCAAVDEYAKLQNKSELSETSEIVVMYGFPIGTWDVSRITNFDRVFAAGRSQTIDPSHGPTKQSSFDDDLSGWDTSNAVTMIGMFEGATSFSGNGLENWNVSKVTDFSFMFAYARKFVGNVSTWDTSSAVNMRAMFRYAEVFNGNISNWDVSRVETMKDMFGYAYKFGGGDLRRWNTSSVLLFDGMFSNAKLFSGKVSTWDTRKAISMVFMVSRCCVGL
jgi:surface protein